jgi:hypothetical protein
MVIPLGSGEVRVLPEDTLADSVLALGTHLRRLSATAVPARDWLTVSPLMVHNDTESKLKRTSLDQAIHDHLASLEDVCHRPVDRLWTVNRLVPVGGRAADRARNDRPPGQLQRGLEPAAAGHR